MSTHPWLLAIGGILLFGCLTTPPTPLSATPVQHGPLTTNLARKDNVLLFPTNARFDPDQQSWIIPVHGWVYGTETDSAWRKTTIMTFAKLIGLQKNTAEERLFRVRAQMFLVDNEEKKNIVVSVGGKQFAAPTTGDNGHFQFNALVRQDKCGHWLDVHIVTNPADTRHLSGHVQCVNSVGVSVISDIDDTIKDSNVLDKKALMQNTFTREFKPVIGMARVYQHWARQGHNFHYISASPWQLYPALQTFLNDRLFPDGSMHLKLVRLKDKSLFNLFDSPEEGKLPIITRLMSQYPQRRFILVGDSGEKDPEIYAEIARQFPARIVRIFIRDIRKDLPRLRGIFRDLPQNIWYAFNDANEILNKPGLLAYHE